MNAADVNDWAWLEAILEGIDKDESDNDKGWWPTSTGAEFGARKLSELKQAITARIAELQRERDDHAHAAWLAQMRVAALEVAQRPRLGYVTVDLQSENPPSLIEADREIASRQLADDRAASPLGDWVLLEVREVQP